MDTESNDDSTSNDSADSASDNPINPDNDISDTEDEDKGLSPDELADLQSELDEMDKRLPPLSPPTSGKKDRKILRDLSSSSFIRLYLITAVVSAVLTFPNPIAHTVIIMLTGLSMTFIYMFLVEFTPYANTSYLEAFWGKRGKLIESYLIILILTFGIAFGYDLLFVFESP